MQIIHRISFNATSEILSTLHSLGIAIETPRSPHDTFVSFEVCESNENWHKVKDLLTVWKAFDFVSTKYSIRELEYAQFLKLAPSWHCGYPQPEDDFGYLNLTYDNSNYCEQCGAGGIQKSPFRMKREPKWGKRHILQLNWVFDEYFVLPEIWERVFRPFGIECLPVLEHKSGKPFDTVVQIKNDRLATSPLSDMVEYEFEICSVCHRKKYLPITRGMFPHCTEKSDVHLFRTQEEFGSGASARNAVIVSHVLYKALRDNHVSGVSFVPLGEIKGVRSR